MGDFRAYFFVVVFTFSFLFFLAPQDGEAACCIEQLRPGCYEQTADSTDILSPCGSATAADDLLQGQTCEQYLATLNSNCLSGVCHRCENGQVITERTNTGTCSGSDYVLNPTVEQAQNFSEMCSQSAVPAQGTPYPDDQFGETPRPPDERGSGTGPTAREAPLPAIIGGTDDIKYATGNYEICDIFSLAIRFSRLLFMLAGAAALILFIWAGIQWITSGGNTEKIDSSKTILKGTVIGLIIMIAAWQMVHMLFVALIPYSGRDAETTPRQIFSSPWYDPCGK